MLMTRFCIYICIQSWIHTLVTCFASLSPTDDAPLFHGVLANKALTNLKRPVC